MRSALETGRANGATNPFSNVRRHAGWTFGGGVEAHLGGNWTGNPFSNVRRHAGWTFGGGVEAHLGGNWTGKIEYLYMAFGSAATKSVDLLATVAALQGAPLAGEMTLTGQFNSHITDQLLRVGLNYKFDAMDLDKVLMLPKDRIAPR